MMSPTGGRSRGSDEFAKVLADPAQYARAVAAAVDRTIRPGSPPARPWVPIGASAGAHDSTRRSHVGVEVQDLSVPPSTALRPASASPTATSPAKRPWLPIGAASGARVGGATSQAGETFSRRSAFDDTRESPLRLGSPYLRSGLPSPSAAIAERFGGSRSRLADIATVDDGVNVHDLAADVTRAALRQCDADHLQGIAASGSQSHVEVSEATLASLHKAEEFLQSYRRELLSDMEGRLEARNARLLSTVGQKAAKVSALGQKTAQRVAKDTASNPKGGKARAKLTAFVRTFAEATVPATDAVEADGSCLVAGADQGSTHDSRTCFTKESDCSLTDERRIRWLDSSVHGWNASPTSTRHKSRGFDKRGSGELSGSRAVVPSVGELLRADASVLHRKGVVTGTLPDDFVLTQLFGVPSKSTVDLAVAFEATTDGKDGWWLASRGEQGMAQGHQFLEFGLSRYGDLDESASRPLWMPIGAAAGAHPRRPRSVPAPVSRYAPAGWKEKPRSGDIAGQDPLTGFASSWMNLSGDSKTCSSSEHRPNHGMHV